MVGPISPAPAPTPSPAPTPAGLDWSAIGSSILADAKAALGAAATGFLTSHPNALAFLEDASIEAAKSLVLYAITSDPDAKADLKLQVDLWRQGIKEEADSIVKDIVDAAPSTFMTIVEDIGKIAMGLAPVLLKAIPI
jgi:hypothetical protein